jgi:hypothetical protein
MRKPAITCDMAIFHAFSGLNSTVVVGGKDGKIRLVDGRLRSSKVIQTIDCHSGPVVSDACTFTV